MSRASLGFATRGACWSGLLLLIPSILAAQANPNEVARDESAFVVQAPAEPESAVAAPQANDNASKVYFPDAITPESVAAARQRAIQQEQLEQAQAAEALAQVSASDDEAREVEQLSDGDSARALAQLSDAERQVLLEAVEGTDICERAENIPAIQALCEQRLETRSAEFTQVSTEESAEDRLLGGSLDSDRIATLETAIARLSRNAGEPGDFSNQVIASVALNTGAATAAPETGEDADPTSDLSAETQAVVNAIVQQLGGN